MVVRVEDLLEEARKEGGGDVAEAEVALDGEGEGFLPKAWELSTQLTMPSRPARMRTMGIATTTRGTTLGALSQMMAQVHGGQRQKNGARRTGMKICQRQRSSQPPMCLQCLCLLRM